MKDEVSHTVKVSQTIWRWREAVQEVDPKALARSVRRRAQIQTVIMLAIAGILFHYNKNIMGSIVLCMTLIIFISGHAIPSMFLSFERFGQTLGRGVATGLTWILLTPFFYITFLPGRLLLLLLGKDPLHRTFPSRNKSMWTPRSPVTNMSSYEKQF